MHRLAYTFGFLLVLGEHLSPHAAVLKPRYGAFVTHERRSAHPDWQDSGRLDPDVAIPLRIGLKQNNLDALPAHLMAISDPESPAYGAHWSHARVAEVFAPAADTHDLVRDWLADSGFGAEKVRLSYNKAWIDVLDATALDVEQLLDTEYRVFKHADGGEHVGSCLITFHPWT
jgi:tripeptidyl-peptidase-1